MTHSTATDAAGPGGAGNRDHPLPLNLDFMFGKGFLWAEQVPLSDWLTLESLRMEIPDLTFPFDAGGGVDRFQNTRCQVREIALSIDESGLASRLNEAAEASSEFHDVRVQFLEDAVHVSLQLRAFGSDTHMSFRTALLPPEPPRADEVHLSMYDYRWFGPLPYPGRLLAYEWLTGVLDTQLFSAPGEGRPFQVGVAGDIASFRPFKLLLLDLFPPHGWKLPNLAGVILDDIHVRPGELVIRATSQEGRWESEAEPLHQLRSSREGRRALAAYESKDLFAPADEALFGGHLGEALELLSNYREKYGLHPQLASRILDCLLADPTASHLAEARSIADELLEDNPDDLRAHLARPIMALVEEGDQAALKHYDELSSVLRRRDDTADWVLSELAAADVLDDKHPREAADRLRTVLKATPNSLPVLERLRSLYRRLGDKEEIEDILKRLTGVYTDRRDLRETYLDLARHLMHREGELAEARHYLQKSLKIDAENLEALEALGESYALSDKPMRAVKAFSSAARIAESREELPRARQLQFRIADLWESELDDPEQALLSVRRAISTTESELDAATSLDRPQAIEFARQLEFAAQLCERLDRPEEAIGHWSEAVSLLQRMVDADDVPSRAVGHVESPDPESPLGRLAKAHRHLATLYVARDRDSAAESHWRRVLELDPAADDIVGELETYYKRAGRAEKLLGLLNTQLRTATESTETVELHRKLADVHDALGHRDKAETHQQRAREVADSEQPLQDDNVWRHQVETHSIGSSVEEDDGGAAESGGSPAVGHDRTTDAGERTVDSQGPSTKQLDHSVPPPEQRDTRSETRDSDPNASRYGETRGDHDEDGDEPTADSERSERSPGSESTVPPDTSGTADTSDADDASDMRSRIDSSDSFELPSLDIDPESSGFGRTSDDRESRESTKQMLKPEVESEESDEKAPSDSELENFRSQYRDLLTGDDDGEAVPPDRQEVPEPDQKTERDDELQIDEEIDWDEAFDAGSDEAVDEPGDDVSDSFDLPSPDSVDDAPSLSSDDFAQALKQRADGDRGSTAQHPQPAAETVRADVAPSATVRIRKARSSDDDERLAEVLAEVLEAHDRSETATDLSDERALELRRELAELYYYELEDAEAALPHLEALRHRDPDGHGAEPTVLRALESIYERRGDTDGRIAILEQQRDRADSEEQTSTYRMLLAQLYWERKGDRDRAESLLEATLEHNPDHEGAHRLLADIHDDEKEYEAAAEHLSTALEIAGDGLDALELERRLAHLYLDHLEAPASAAEHFAAVLEDAPGDSRAIEGRKLAQSALEDWEGYIETLRHELGVQLGEPEGVAFEEVDPETGDEGLRMTASQIMAEAADVAHERLDDPERAHGWYGQAYSIWSQNLEALESRIALDRSLDRPDALADDLERFADGLLDATAQFEALWEAAQIWDELGDDERATELLVRAVDAGAEADPPPDELEAARETLDEATDDDTDD